MLRCAGMWHALRNVMHGWHGMQDPHMRPNFTAVVDMMRELRDSGCVGKLDTFYWSKGSAYV